MVGFAIVALGLQLHGTDPRVQQLVVRLPSTERYRDKLTKEGQGFPTKARFVDMSNCLYGVQFETECNPLMHWAKSKGIEKEMVENTHPIGRISTTADVERYLQLLFKRNLYGASTAAESIGHFEQPLVTKAYDITCNGRAKSHSSADETHLGYAAMDRVDKLEERLRGASILADTFVKCTVSTDESVHLATKLCSDILPAKLWATLMGPILPLSSNIIVSVMDAWCAITEPTFLVMLNDLHQGIFANVPKSNWILVSSQSTNRVDYRENISNSSFLREWGKAYVKAAKEGLSISDLATKWDRTAPYM